jgi:hypothetical protein
MKSTEASAYFWGNTSKTIQYSSKGAVAVYSSKRFAVTDFKATQDFGRGTRSVEYYV